MIINDSEYITVIINEFAVLIVEASYDVGDVVCDLGEHWTAQQFLLCNRRRLKL